MSPVVCVFCVLVVALVKREVQRGYSKQQEGGGRENKPGTEFSSKPQVILDFPPGYDFPYSPQLLPECLIHILQSSVTPYAGCDVGEE